MFIGGKFMENIKLRNKLNKNKKRVRNNTVLKNIIKGIISLSIIFILLQGYIIIAPYTNKAVKSDVAIVLGCKTGTAFLSNRVEKAYTLYKEGLVKKIVVTGGVGDSDTISEGEWEMNRLLELGVRKEDILLEDKSKNTFENIKFAKELMDKKNLNTAIIVSNSFHLRRAEFLAKNQNMKVSLSGVFDERYKDHEYYGYLREVPALIKDFLLHFFM